MSKQKNSEIVIIANTIAVAIAQDLNADEENILGNLFALVGASLLSLAALDNSDSSTNSNSSDNTKSPDNSTSTDTSTCTNAAKDSAQTTVSQKA
jgi:hypothetical protein